MKNKQIRLTIMWGGERNIDYNELIDIFEFLHNNVKPFPTLIDYKNGTFIRVMKKGYKTKKYEIWIHDKEDYQNEVEREGLYIFPEPIKQLIK